MYRLYLFFLLVASTVALAQELGRGIIRGTVLDEMGSPVTNAYVTADVMKGDRTLKALDTYTDSTGQFVFEGLSFGKFSVSAEKQADGYRSTRRDVFGQTPLIVSLTSDELAATAIIRFPAKSGLISGWVRDAKTAVSIPAQLNVAPINGSRFLGTGTNGESEFHLLLPANSGFMLQVSANGYKPWVYEDVTNVSMPAQISLEPGTEMKMDIRLEPLDESGK